MFFLALFCLCFCFMVWQFVPETVWKNSLDVRSCIFGFVLSSLGFFSSTLFLVFCVVFFKRQSSGSNRTAPHALVLLVLVLFFCPAALVCSPFLAVRPCFLAVFRGAILGPVRFWDSPGTYGARACSPLPRPLFLGREAARVFCASLAFFFSPPFVLFCGYTFL